MIFQQPLYLVAAIPCILVLVWLLYKDFLSSKKRFKDDAEALSRQRRYRGWMLVSRSLIILFLIASLADPVIEELRVEESDPQLLVLHDVSRSMGVLDTSGYEALIDNLKSDIAVRARDIGGSDTSLAEDILTYVTQGENILLLTDGNSNTGASLSEVSLFAASINASVSAISLEPSSRDTAVRIEGPKRVVADTNATYVIHISSTHNDPVSLRIRSDDVVLFDEQTTARQIPVIQSFSEGEHTLTVELGEDDHFSENNMFVQTISAIEKPYILHVTRKQSGLDQLLDTLYRVDTQTALPSQLDDYYAVVLEDLPANTIGQMDVLRSYLEKGNGLVVAGGQKSFDKGGYKGSVFETLLPVRVGTGERQKGDANIVLAIDMSGSTGTVLIPREQRRTVSVSGTTAEFSLEYAVAGLDVDAILLTKDPNFSPTGREKPSDAGWVEAESGSFVGSGLFTGVDTRASDQSYLSLQPRPVGSEPGISTYSVTVPEPGTYYVWMRVRTQGGSDVESRSVYVELSDDGRRRWVIDRSTKWLWKQVTDPGKVELEEVTSNEQALQKSLAISVLEDLHPGNAVGVLGFTYPLPSDTDQVCTGPCVVRHVTQLGKEKEAVADKIARINITGNTAIWVGLEGAIQMLERSYGSMNIILLTDGVTNSDDEKRSVDAARAIASRGGRLYAVQVGDDERGSVFLLDLARNGNGIFFSATQLNRLGVLFGDPDTTETADSFGIVPLNAYHFITKDIEPQAILYGYNQVVPKFGSQVLVTSAKSDPVITVWNFGVGRVATLTGFNGPGYGELLQSPDSKLVSRTVNWAIGDPERKQQYRLLAQDAYLHEQATLLVHSEQLPQADGLTFDPIGQGVFSAKLATDQQGVFSVLSTQYSVNYARELSAVGMHSSLQNTLALTGGKLFSIDDTSGIVDFAQKQQLRTTSEKKPIRWPFLLAALVLLLIEIAARRLRELRKNV